VVSRNKKNSPACIEYSGVPGASKECQDAVLRLLQYGDTITRVRILSHSNTHALLLTINVGDLVAVKSGFGSGYLGEGSRTFSYVLQLLDTHDVEIEEYEVSEDLIERLDDSSLTRLDINNLDNAHPIRPSRWRDYVFEDHWELQENGKIWREFRPVIPFAIIDDRIVDLALTFWEGPNDKLRTGYTRLEDIVRKRTGINEYGTKLFSQVFRGQLGWNDPEEAERTGKTQLFTSVYMAYRNPRAHRELKNNSEEELLAEFLLLNHLYLLEKKSVESESKETP
jgi:hypothetical protein